MPEPTPRHARAPRRAAIRIDHHATLGGRALDEHPALAVARDEGRQLVERLAERAGSTVHVRSAVVVHTWVVVDPGPSWTARLVHRVRFSALAQALFDLRAALAGLGALWAAEAKAVSDHEYARGYAAGYAAWLDARRGAVECPRCGSRTCPPEYCRFETREPAEPADPTGVVSMNKRRAAMGLPEWDEGIRCGHTLDGVRCQYDAWHDGTPHTTAMPRCGHELGGDRCDHRAGHPGTHSTARAAWEVG